MIPWPEFLNLLEGQTVHLATPKSHYAQDIVLLADIPVFSTSISMIKFSGSRSSNIEGENAMMEARWRKFEKHCKKGNRSINYCRYEMTGNHTGNHASNHSSTLNCL